MSDCEDLVSHLRNPTAKSVADKRLSLDLAGLRQLLWEDQNGDLRDELSDDQPDNIIWIDTSAMPVDCMTKAMKPDTLHRLLETGVLDLEPTDESVLLKLRKAKLKREAKATTNQDRVEQYEA